jgi:hypothetical protein
MGMGSDAAALFPFSTSTTATSPRLCGATAVSHRRSAHPPPLYLYLPSPPFHFLCIASHCRHFLVSPSP